MADSLANASDAELLAISDTVLAAVTPNPTNFGVNAGWVVGFELARDTSVTELNGHNTQQAAAKAQTITKDAAMTILRDLIRDLRASTKAAKTAPNEVASLGIPSGSETAPSNATVPIGVIDTSKRLEHTINFRDVAHQDTKRKPRGVNGCEIWVKIGEPAPGNQKGPCVYGTRHQNALHRSLRTRRRRQNRLLYAPLGNARRCGFGLGRTISATITR